MGRPDGQGARGAGLVAFGLGLLTDLTPPGAWVQRPLSGEPTVSLRAATADAIAESWSGLDAIGWEGVIDGAPFVAERGLAGDYRFVHGATVGLSRGGAGSAPGSKARAVPDALPAPKAVHHLSADGSVLRCAPSRSNDPSWWRLVLDSVLFTVALTQGYEALHAAALATPDGDVIAITASMGGGKSTLLSELLRRGLSLMADDVLVLETRGTEVPPLAHPAPPLMSIPAARLPMFVGPPEPICSLEEEHWIAVAAHPGPLPLRTLVVLDRRPGSQLSLSRIEDSLAPLMGSLMNFPRTPERARARFELASVLAARTELWRLTADTCTPPEVLVDALGVCIRC